ncbi:hypothetical protein E2C01_038152 [Portunus trituberculatus]|uniref:Uncharacterized protein n=1 Tax=Portunus trituberculatus TaxID=210409 RepID=A0A5B7FGV0_PORTR|nr:hypothetical protein [Portunus trituberculatus]
MDAEQPSPCPPLMQHRDHSIARARLPGLADEGRAASPHHGGCRHTASHSSLKTAHRVLHHSTATADSHP